MTIITKGEDIYTVKNMEAILDHYKGGFELAPCSKGHHLAWRGGLKIHTGHVLGYARMYFPLDALLHFCAGVHDLGKTRVYCFVDKHMNGKETIEYTKPPVDHILHTITMLAEVGIILDTEALHAIQFHHGGWSPFSGDMSPLAVKLHFCDMMATAEENICGKNN